MKLILWCGLMMVFLPGKGVEMGIYGERGSWLKLPGEDSVEEV